MTMSTGHRWNDTDGGKPKDSEKILSNAALSATYPTRTDLGLKLGPLDPSDHSTAKLLPSEPSSMSPARHTTYITFSNHGNHARCAQKTRLCHKISAHVTFPMGIFQE